MSDALALPQVPARWQPWVDALVFNLSERRKYLWQLELSHERLERRVTERTNELVEVNRQLEQLALIDPLTDAYNRRYLYECLSTLTATEMARRAGFSLLMLDLDHFKKVNDHNGHLAGDTVLRELVRLCKQAVRLTDTVCRFGGEEFAIVLPGMRIDSARTFAQWLCDKVAQTPVWYDGRAIAVTVSIGVAVYRQGETVDSLLARADRVLYDAKRTGRNRIACEESEVTTAPGEHDHEESARV